MTIRKGEETYQKMIDVAIYYFAKDGIHKTSFSKIAEALHMTKPSLYYYIESKEELIRKVFNYVLEDYKFSSYFDEESLEITSVENYLIQGGNNFIEETAEQSIIIDLLNEFTLYANRMKAEDESFIEKIEESRLSFLNGFEHALRVAKVEKSEIILRAQTLAIMLDHIQQNQQMSMKTDEKKLWKHIVTQTLKS